MVFYNLLQKKGENKDANQDNRRADKIAILVVCRANICRSPMAEGILKHLLQERGQAKSIKVDSAGTHAGLIRSRPDLRAQRVAQAHGIDISKIKSRRVRMKDFERFSHILAMDQDNIDALLKVCPQSSAQRLSLILEHSSDSDLQEVPDPYYGNEQGFEHVYTLLHQAIDDFLTRLTQG